MQNLRDGERFYAYARHHERPKAKNGLEKHRGALRRIADRHVDHDRFAISHVRHLVIQVRKPVDCASGAFLEPPLQLCGVCGSAKFADRGFTSCIPGGRQVWTGRFEIEARGGMGKWGSKAWYRSIAPWFGSAL